MPNNNSAVKGSRREFSLPNSLADKSPPRDYRRFKDRYTAQERISQWLTVIFEAIEKDTPVMTESIDGEFKMFLAPGLTYSESWRICDRSTDDLQGIQFSELRALYLQS